MKTNHQNLRVLLVDDAPSILLPLEHLLHKSGFLVMTAQSGTEAIETIKEELPHVVVLDVMLPDMDGFEVCRYIRSKSGLEGIKVIFLSARSKEVDVEKGYDAGADLYVVKPFSPGYLIEKIKELTGT